MDICLNRNAFEKIRSKFSIRVDFWRTLPFEDLFWMIFIFILQPNTRITSTIAGRWNDYASTIVARSNNEFVPSATISAHSQLKHRSVFSSADDESSNARRCHEWCGWTSNTAGRITFLFMIVALHVRHAGTVTDCECRLLPTSAAFYWPRTVSSSFFFS